MTRRPRRKKDTTFHTEDLWPQITALCKSGSGHVAVAFLGKDSYKLLPLSAGSVLVVTRVVRGTWDAETTAVARRVRPAARARLEEGDTLDTFSWPRREAADFEPGHQVVEIFEEDGHILVYPPATILVPPAGTAKGKGATSVVFTGRPRDQRALDFKEAQRALGRHSGVLGKSKELHRVRSRPAAQALRQLWSDS